MTDLIQSKITITPSDRFAVVSHDAGGAEILSSYVRRHSLNPIYVIEGPARKVFERKIGSIEAVPIQQAIDQTPLLLCGTSWQSDLEFDALVLARSMGKCTISFLDHWVNYRERFTRNGETFLPDQIWVGDSTAKVMADELFSGHSVFLEDNPYFIDVLDELAMAEDVLQKKSELSVLYICEPISEHAILRYGNERYWGYIEEEALRYFLSNISVLGGIVKCIRIRPHPSEDLKKYNWALNEFSLPIEIGGEDALLSEIAMSNVIVGCESMAMVIGLLAKKRVVSCIPPGGRECVLPHIGIERLQKLVSNFI